MSTLRPTPLLTLMMLHLALVVWYLLAAYGCSFMLILDADGTFLDKVFISSGCLHQVWHQVVELVLEHGVERLLCCHCANLLPQNAKKATPWKSGNRLSACFRWLFQPLAAKLLIRRSPLFVFEFETVRNRKGAAK